MKTRFVRFATKDKLLLQGLLYEPEKKTSRIVVHVHGMAGNFYENRFLDSMAHEFTSNDWAFFVFNNRGHGYIADFPIVGKAERYKRIGNSREKFSECIFDIQAAVDFVFSIGYKDITLQGHSLGSSKVIYYQVKTNDKRVKKLLLASPANMVGYTEKMNKNHKKIFLESQKMIKNGKGEDLLQYLLDGWYYLSAKTYIDFAFRKNPVNIINVDRKDESSIIEKITIPVFAYIGSKDFCMAVKPEEGLQILKEKAKNASRFDTFVIKNSTHGYFGDEEKVAKLVVAWLNQTS